MISSIRTVSRETVLAPVHLWRLISRLLPPRCKYHPSCSQYCLDAVRSRGIITGLLLATWRVLRCNPWSYGGYDPAPPRFSRRTAHETAPPAVAVPPLPSSSRSDP